MNQCSSILVRARSLVQILDARICCNFVPGVLIRGGRPDEEQRLNGSRTLIECRLTIEELSCSNLGAKWGANVVTYRSDIPANETLELHRVVRSSLSLLSSCSATLEVTFAVRQLWPADARRRLARVQEGRRQKSPPPSVQRFSEVISVKWDSRKAPTPLEQSGVPLEARKGRNLHVVLKTCLFKRRFCTDHGRGLVRTPHNYWGS